ncbi:hypothetical protein [Halocatena halophila]|uniref:hypothetical protein n=1 Tax=Halocatena halophila TaxID=2814576 RepID=UPI002ED39731
MEVTRRHLIRSLLGTVTGVNIANEVSNFSSADKNTITNSNKCINKRDERMTQTAYLAPPSMSFTTMFSYLPYLMNTNQSPIILMDSYDLERLQGRVIRERGNQEVQVRGEICDQLLRQGIIKGVDYAKFYPSLKQNQYLRKYQKVLDDLPDHILQESVSRSADIFINTNRGDYQKPVRNSLGNWDLNERKRQKIRKQQKRFEGGLGDPKTWHERVFGKYIAALEVRHKLDQQLDYNVVGVLGQGDREGIGAIIDSSDIQFNEDILRTREGSHTIDQIGRPNLDKASDLNNKLDQITTIAQETTGVQYQDWYILGSRLAIPQFSDLLTKTHGLNGQRWDPSSVADETQEVLDYLENHAIENKPNHLRYEAERIVENYERTDQTTQKVLEDLEAASDLSNYASEIRSLAEEGQFSPTALYVAMSIKMDPKHCYNEDDLYQKAVALKRRLQPVGVTDSEIESFRKRGSFRLGGKRRNWHQTLDRTRKTTYSNSL